MATFSDLDQIVAWKKARCLAKEGYLVTNKSSLQKDYSLSNQIKRSAGSVMDNIAEGFGRGATKNSYNSCSSQGDRQPN